LEIKGLFLKIWQQTFDKAKIKLKKYAKNTQNMPKLKFMFQRADGICRIGQFSKQLDFFHFSVKRFFACFKKNKELPHQKKFCFICVRIEKKVSMLPPHPPSFSL